MRKLMRNHANSFPAPVHGGSAAIWHLVDISFWLQAKGRYNLEQSLIDVAKLAMQINFVKSARELGPEVHQDLFAAMA